VARRWPSGSLSVGSVVTLGTLVNWVAAPAGLHDLLLCRHLHDVAEALDAAEHRHRRRCRRVPADDRLGRGHRHGLAWKASILFLIIFMWTPPHFWALALFKLRDYDMAGVPMLPNVAGERHTKLQIVAYSVVLTASPFCRGRSVSPVRPTARSPFCSALNFCAMPGRSGAWPDGDATMVPAKKLFGFSLVYLASLFSVLLAERWSWRWRGDGDDDNRPETI
jgi:hypothetical protein